MTKMIVITGFVIAFCAGVMSGVLYQGHGGAARSDDPRKSRESWIADQLSLSEDQQKQMKEIWSSIGGRRNEWDKKGKIRREREEAIAGLIRPEDKAAYDKIVADAKQKQDAVDNEGKKAFQAAVEKTKAILNPEQREKYEQLLARGPDRGRDGRDRDKDRDRGTTRPAQQ